MLEFAAKHLNGMTDHWERAYDLSLDVYSSLGEIALKFGNYEEALNASIEVERNARSLEDKIRAQVVSVGHKVQGGSRDYPGGIERIKNILLDYGVKFPQKLIPGQQFVEKRKLKSRLGGDLQSFLSLPKLDEGDHDDKRKCNIILLLTHLIHFTFYDDKVKDLNVYAIIRVLNTSVKHGTCSGTALALGALAGYLSRGGHSEDAKECGELAIKLVNTFPRKVDSCHTSVHSWVTFSVLPNVLPFHDCLDPLLELNQCALMAGDISSAAMAWVGYSYTYLNIGLPIGPLSSDLLSYSKEAKQFGMPTTMQVLFPILLQTIQNLQVLKPNPTMLLGDIFDQEQELKKFKDVGLKMTQRDINSFRLMLACIYRKWETAEELVDALQPHLQSDIFTMRAHLHLVYMGYASLVLGEKASALRRRIHFRQLGKKIIKIFKDQLKYGSKNVLHVILMLEAIESPSKEKFDEAIRNTARLGMVHHAAAMYENAGLYFLDKDDEGWGEYYLSQAYNLYNDWGATGKANQLKDSHQVLSSSSVNHRAKGGFMKGRTRFSPEHLDHMKEMRLSSVSGRTLNAAEKTSFTLNLSSNSSFSSSRTSSDGGNTAPNKSSGEK